MRFNKLTRVKKNMADFFEQEWNTYKIRLRPKDWIRDPINRLPFLLDVIPYFSATYICFDLRLFIPRKKSKKWYQGLVNLFPELKRKEHGVFKYEWQLCDDNNEPIELNPKQTICFHNPSGNGLFEFNTEKVKKKELEKVGYITGRDKDGYYFRKIKSIDIGRLNKLAHYNILMRFTTADGMPSDWKLMASFKLFDKDMFRISGCLPAIISFMVTILTFFVLRGCGLKP